MLNVKNQFHCGMSPVGNELTWLLGIEYSGARSESVRTMTKSRASSAARCAGTASGIIGTSRKMLLG